MKEKNLQFFIIFIIGTINIKIFTMVKNITSCVTNSIKKREINS